MQVLECKNPSWNISRPVKPPEFSILKGLKHFSTSPENFDLKLMRIFWSICNAPAVYHIAFVGPQVETKGLPLESLLTL